MKFFLSKCRCSSLSTSLLELVLLQPIGFDILCFHFCLFQDILNFFFDSLVVQVYIV